jgi:uncharacterized membrane protein
MSNAASAGGDQTPRRRWLKPLLIVSLALNLLFAGLIAGAMWKRHHGHWRPKHVVLQLSIEQMMRELPPDKRTVGEKVLKQLRNEVRPSRGELRARRKEAVAALTADPYVEKEFSDKMAALRDIRESARRKRHEIVIEFVRDMTVAQRKRFVEIFRSNLRGPRIPRDKRRP